MLEKVIRAPIMRPTMSERGVKLCAEVVGVRDVGMVVESSGCSLGEEDGVDAPPGGSGALPAMLRVW